MKVLLLSLLLGALLAPSQAGDKAEAEGGVEAAGESGVVKRSADCPAGWARYKSRCYLYVQASSTWAEAERFCLARGANLASVHNKRQYKWVQKYIHRKSRGYPATWIGGSDAEQEHYWFWSDGSRLTFSKWCSGYPRTNNGFNCMVISPQECSCWHDYPCYYRFPFICVRK